MQLLSFETSHFHHTKHFRKKEPCVRCKTYLSPQENASLLIIALVWSLPSLPAVLVTGSNNTIHATHVYGTNLDPNFTSLYVFSVLAGNGKSLEKTNDWHKPFHNNVNAHHLPSFLKRFKAFCRILLPKSRSSQSAKQKDCIMNYNITRAELLRTTRFFIQSCWKEKPFLQSPLNFAPGVVRSQSHTKPS
jgi:hypothetical protein